MTILKAACIQTNSRPDIAENLALIEPMIREARDNGAQFIALPENVCMMTRGRENIFANARPENEHPGIPFFQRVAKETAVWILGGTLAIVVAPGKLANRCYLYSPDGKIAAHYDKIHLFDVDISAEEKYRESENFQRGERAVIADVPWGKLGLTICYDIRFPHLYRALAKAGANMITVPAAFTVPTGQMHWHVLLRGRAIETGAFVLAPAQCGMHEGGRHTYGHSLIIDPLGKILAEGDGEKPGIIMADLDLAKTGEARRMLPSLKHDRAFEGP